MVFSNGHDVQRVPIWYNLWYTPNEVRSVSTIKTNEVSYYSDKTPTGVYYKHTYDYKFEINTANLQRVILK